MQAVCNKWIMIELMSFIIQVFSLIELHGQCMMAVSIDCGWHIVSRYCICCDQLTVVFSVTTLMDCLWLNNGRIINRRQASKDSLSRLYFRDRGRDLFNNLIFSFLAPIEWCLTHLENAFEFESPGKWRECSISHTDLLLGTLTKDANSQLRITS